MQILHRRRARLTSLLSAFALVLGVAVVQLNPAGATTVAGAFELDGNPQESSTAPGDDWQTLLPGGADSAEAATAIPIFDGADSPTDTSYFKGGGSKDERNIGLWAYSGTDVAPDKDEIVNAAAAAYLVPDQGGAAGDSDSEDDLVLAFHSDRFSNDGDAAIGFWFLKKHIVLDGGKFKEDLGNGTLAAGSHAVGDVLVVSDFNEGEGINTIRVFKWTAAGLVEASLPGTGSVDCQNEVHNPFVCATENRTNQDDIDALWPYTPKSNVGVDGAYPDFTFLEGAINTSAVLPGSDRCFASFLAETRSSTSTTAQLKDFVLGSFPVCEPGTTLAASPTTAAPEVAVAGDSVTVTFTETNDGNVGLTNVSVTEDSSLCTLSPASVASLPPGGSQAFTCTVATPAGSAQIIDIVGIGHGLSPLGDVTFCATGTTPANTVCDAGEKATARIVTILPGTDLAAIASPTTAKEGDTVTFTVTEQNDGTAPTGYTASLALANVSVTASAGTGATSAEVTACNTGLASAPVKSGVGGNQDALLEPGETWTYSCTVTAPADNFTLNFTGTGTVLTGTSHARTVTFCDTPCTAGQFHDAEERAAASVTIISPSTELTITANAVMTYTFKEKNDSADAPLSIPDGSTDRTKVLSLEAGSTQLCNVSAIVYASGDAGVANVLDPGETWTFTCQGSLAGPTDVTGNGTVSSTSTLVGIGDGKDVTGDHVTYPGDPDERDRVTVTINYYPRGAN